MCGLVGFWHGQHKFQDLPTTIAKMTDSLTHRGPNDSGIWFDLKDGIALGHRRLSILDLSVQGHQPMHSHNDHYVIIYNGEIYNYQVLKKQLQENHHSFISQSDTEVILALITHYGLEVALQRMTGMFAFALWDKKNKILHLARDRMGEKPLYYGLVNNSLVFGSELKALRFYPDFQNKIDRNSVALFMQYGYVPAPKSIYDQIYKLLPGTYLSLNLQHLQSLPTPKPYWSAVASAHAGLDHPLQIADTQAIQTTDDMLTAIVQKQMISDVPIGAFLSGGIDSSLITALMQKNSTVPIKTFTIGFQDQSYNEAGYAKAIAQHLHTEHTELFIDAYKALNVIPNLSTIYDEPFADSSAIPTFLIAQLTQQHVSVCLSGDGGDELFGGYNRYLLGQNLSSVVSFLPYSLRLLLKKSLTPLSTGAWLKYARIPLVQDKIQKLAAILAVAKIEDIYPYLISQWFNPREIVLEVDERAVIHNGCLKNGNFVQNMMLQDSLCYLPDDIMVKVDRACMAVSLENRAPFLDHSLFEWAWRLPLQMKIRKRSSKWLLKALLSQYMPPALFERPKMGFSIPLDAWLRGPLRDWAETLLNKNTIQAQGYLNWEPIRKKWEEHVTGKRNWQYPLWTVLMFQAWLMSIQEVTSFRA